MTARSVSFRTTVQPGPKGRALLALPFEPDEVWGTKTAHRVGGSVDGVRIRGIVESVGDGHGIVLGAAWLRECTIAVGDEVAVTLAPEGPLRDDLAEDVAVALEASPPAGAFFDSLAQFYRKGYLRWIDGTTRRPDLRAARIAEMVELLEAGRKERPKGPPAG